MNVVDKKNKYECGKCKKIIKIGEKEPIKCNMCGYRIVYKIRSKNSIQYLAR